MVNEKIVMIYYEIGSTETELNAEDLKKGLFEAFNKMGKKYKVLAIPPVHGESRTGTKAQ